MALRKMMFLDMITGQLPPINKDGAAAVLLNSKCTKTTVPYAENALCMGAIATEHYYGGAEKIIRQQQGKHSIETHCGDCGARINQHSRFCAYCGTRFRE